MGRIVVLEPRTVNMIAAGEVIERPASIVKELVENSIDAGAARIDVRVVEGGRRLISVTDDGTGMDAEDLAKAFDPHATSKIAAHCDLDSVATMGFRGEALASIAAVAQVRAVSKTGDEDAGNCIEIDCGKKTPVKACSADCGTIIEVRNIFCRLPARSKFLKSAGTEMTHIAEQFKRTVLGGFQAFGKPVEAALIHNQRRLCHLTAGQDLRQRIASLFGDFICEDLIEIVGRQPSSSAAGSSDLRVSALAGGAATARATGKFQYVFLNGRFIRDKSISHAIRQAYEGFLDPKRFAVIFLFLEAAPESYDVNVHPTKIEVRFRNSSAVHSVVCHTLRQALMTANLRKSAHAPGHQSKTFVTAGERPGPLPTDAPRRVAEPAALFETDRRDAPSPTKRKFMQIHNSFIAVETPDGFMLVDQHALHERLIYDRLREKMQLSRFESQRLLIPETLSLDDAEARIAESNAELLERLGIELAEFGPKTWAIQAFPTALSDGGRRGEKGISPQPVEPGRFVRDLLDLLDTEGAAAGQAALESFLRLAACKTAVKAGKKLTDAEIEQLLEESDDARKTVRCPHGRPAVIEFSKAEIERQFDRTVSPASRRG